MVGPISLVCRSGIIGGTYISLLLLHAKRNMHLVHTCNDYICLMICTIYYNPQHRVPAQLHYSYTVVSQVLFLFLPSLLLCLCPREGGGHAWLLSASVFRDSAYHGAIPRINHDMKGRHLQCTYMYYTHVYY